MKNYLVTWCIDIDDTDSPESAAIQALEIMQDKDSQATFFSVIDKNTGKLVDVDLMNLESYLVIK